MTGWLGDEADVGFRFLEPAHVAAAMEDAGPAGRGAARARTSYPEEHDTRRGYLPARRRS